MIFSFHTSVVRTNIKTGELLKMIHIFENKDTYLFFTDISKPVRHKMQFFFQINISTINVFFKNWYLIDIIYYLCLLLISVWYRWKKNHNYKWVLDIKFHTLLKMTCQFTSKFWQKCNIFHFIVHVHKFVVCFTSEIILYN